MNVPVSVVQVNGANHHFHLTSPIDLEARREAGRFVIEYQPLRISVYGSDEAEAYRAFAEMFELIWDQIAEAPDRELTGDARELKGHFRGLVGRVAPPLDE
jgi:hypothetical protein